MKLPYLLAVAAPALLLGACHQTPPAGSEASVSQSAAASMASDASAPVASAVSASPSFDCAHALPGAQTVVCGDNQLAQLDAETDRLYKLIDAHVSDPERLALKRLQDGWTAKRDACAATVAVKTCLIQAYASRIADLRAGYKIAADDATGLSLGPVSWRCPGAAALLSSTFINVSPGLVFLRRDDTSVVLTQAVSADGGRYTASLPDGPSGGDYEFWTKGDETRFTVPGQAAVTCTRVG
jgi:uncharacterized protein